MKALNFSTDKFAIALSGLCILHCLALPVLIALAPSLAAWPMAQEEFHLWMVVAVIPSSLYALTIGCKKHNRKSLLGYGLVGLALLVSAVLFGESLGEIGEKSLTTIGGLIIAITHIKNYMLCRKADECECSDS